MAMAVSNLSPTPDYLLIDGNAEIETTVQQETIVGGDGVSVSIAAASIVAKVTRDKMMEQLLSRYPEKVDAQLVNAVCADLMQNKQFQQVVGYLDTYLAAHPDNVPLMMLRLQAQQEDPLNLTAEQRQALQKQVIQAVSDPKQRALLMANQYRASGEYEKAKEVLENNPQVDKDDPDVVMRRFEVALEQKDLAAAEQLRQIIRTGNLDGCEGNLAAARVEYAKENYPVALRRLNECLAMTPLSSEIYFLKSQVERQMKDENAAIESARTAVRMNPKSPVYIKNLASLLIERNTVLGNKVTAAQRDEARRTIDAARRLNPMDWQLQSVYAETIQQSSPDEALAIRQQLLKDYPTVTNALMLGNMAMRMAQSEWNSPKKDALIELAGKAYQRGMEIDPTDEMLLQTYADYQQKTGKGQDAITRIKQDKNLEWAFYLRNGQFEQAETILKELLQETPDDAALVKGLVLACQKTGKQDEVKHYLEVLFGLDDSKDTQLWILQKYIDNNLPAEAEKHLAGFKEHYPDEAAALLIESWVEMNKGRLDEAMALVNRYLETVRASSVSELMGNGESASSGMVV